MRVKGALHVHSTLSHDGTMTIAELAEWYRDRAYQFIALGEHSQDLSEEKVECLNRLSAENSDGQFCILPGIEFSCREGIHIFAPGTTCLIRETDPVAVACEIRAQGGFPILAHPQRMRWACPSDVLLAVDAVEFWNVGYDGKFLPPSKAPLAFRRMRDINPQLYAVAGQDLHNSDGFYDVAIEMEVLNLSRPAVLQTLRRGRYQIRSPFFRVNSSAQLSWGKCVLLRLVSGQLEKARRARSFLLREST